MFKEQFKKNLIKTLCLSIISILFLTLVISLNYKNPNTTYTNFLALPFYFRILFSSFIPIFGNIDYLYYFAMLYFIPLSLIYTAYLAKFEKGNIYLLPISYKKLAFNNFLSLYSHSFILITISYLVLIINSIICYQCFYLSLVYAYIISLCLSLSLYFLISTTKDKITKILNYTLLLYTIILFILSSLLKSDYLYLISPLNLLINLSTNPLNLIFPLLILIIAFSNKYLRPQIKN